VAVRSAQLGQVGVFTASTTTTIYTAPSGVRTILKWLTCYSPNSLQVRIQMVTPVGAIDLLNQVVGAPSVVNLEVWQVMNAGDLIRVSTAAGATDVRVLASGTELVL